MDQGNTQSNYLHNLKEERIYFPGTSHQAPQLTHKHSDKQSSYSKSKYHRQYSQKQHNTQTRLNLNQACQENDTARVLELVKNGSSDLDIRDSDGHTPLYWACCRGNVDICRTLLEAGCDVNARGKNGATALMACADNGHEACLHLLLQVRSISLDITSARGDSALHMAAYRGYSEIVRLLCNAGANAELKNSNDQTPTAVALVSNQIECLNVLTNKDKLGHTKGPGRPTMRQYTYDKPSPSQGHTHLRKQEQSTKRQHSNDKHQPFQQDLPLYKPKTSTRQYSNDVSPPTPEKLHLYKPTSDDEIHFVSTDSGVGFSSTYNQSYSQTRSRSPVCVDERLSSHLGSYNGNSISQGNHNNPLSLTSVYSSSIHSNQQSHSNIWPTFVHDKDRDNSETKTLHRQLSYEDNTINVTLVSSGTQYQNSLPSNQNYSLPCNQLSRSISSPLQHQESRKPHNSFKSSTINFPVRTINRDINNLDIPTQITLPRPSNDLRSHTSIDNASNSLLPLANHNDKTKKDDTIYRYNIIDNETFSGNNENAQNPTSTVTYDRPLSTAPHYLNIPPVVQNSSENPKPGDSFPSSATEAELSWNMDLTTYVETLQMRLVMQDGILQQERNEKAQLQTQNYMLKNEIMKLKDTIRKLNLSIPKQPR